jgi:hypothetical protein
MGCNCGKNKTAVTADAAEAMRRQGDFEARVQAEMAKSSTGEHDPKPERILPRIVRR